MKNYWSVLFSGIVLTSCATGANNSKGTIGDTRTKDVKLIADNQYELIEKAAEKSYGFTKENPVKVGGTAEDSGPKNERRFLNALNGPKGEQVGYYRAGSCCLFETPNGLFNNSGMLDMYRVYFVGTTDTVTLYLNMYDKGDLKIPVGFAAKH